MSTWDDIFGGKELFGISKRKLRKMGYRTARQYLRGQLNLPLDNGKYDFDIDDVVEATRLGREVLHSPLLDEKLRPIVLDMLERLLG